MTFAPLGGSNDGTLAYLCNGLEIDYKPGAQAGQLLGFSLDAKGNSPLASGQVAGGRGRAKMAVRAIMPPRPQNHSPAVSA